MSKNRVPLFIRRMMIPLTALLALFAVIPSLSIAAKMTTEERLEMKKRVQKQIENGEIPTAEPGMSYEERLYIKKKQQLLESQKQQQEQETQPQYQKHAEPPKGKHQPPPPPGYNSYPRYGHQDYENRTDHPFTRPHHSRYEHRYSHEQHWRWQRCRMLWGMGYEFDQCLQGDDRYLHPNWWQRRGGTTVFIQPPPQQIDTPVDEYSPPSLRAVDYPVWHDAQLTGESVITARDSTGWSRSFHLVGIRASHDPGFTSTCIADNLYQTTIRVNEVASSSEFRGADGEAFIFQGDSVLNIQVLAEGCAEFDAVTCNDLNLDSCDILQDAESEARRNHLGIWQ